MTVRSGPVRATTCCSRSRVAGWAVRAHPGTADRYYRLVEAPGQPCCEDRRGLNEIQELRADGPYSGHLFTDEGQATPRVVQLRQIYAPPFLIQQHMVRYFRKPPGAHDVADGGPKPASATSGPTCHLREDRGPSRPSTWHADASSWNCVAIRRYRCFARPIEPRSQRRTPDGRARTKRRALTAAVLEGRISTRVDPRTRVATMTLARIIAIVVLTHMAFVAARIPPRCPGDHASTFTVGVIMALFALVPMLIGAGGSPARRGRTVATDLTGTLLILGYAAAGAVPFMPPRTWPPAGLGRDDRDQPDVDDDLGAAGRGRRADRIGGRHLVAAGSVDFRVHRAGRALSIDWFGHARSSGHWRSWLSWRCYGSIADCCPHAREGERPGTLHPLELLRHTEPRHVLIATALVSMSWDLQMFVIPASARARAYRPRDRPLRASRSRPHPLACRGCRGGSPNGRCHPHPVQRHACIRCSAVFVARAIDRGGHLLGLARAAQPNVMSLVHSRSPQGRVGEAGSAFDDHPR